MNTTAASLLRVLEAAEAVVWIQVERTQGSAPRDAGAGMWVSRGAAGNTIGGGHLEQVACELARTMLDRGEQRALLRQFPLGPALGQCCGGRVELLLLPLGQADRPWLQAWAEAEAQGQGFEHSCVLESGAPYPLRWQPAPWRIAVFGAGHVGQALMSVLSPLPCSLQWFDSRPDVFPAQFAERVQCVECDDPAAEVAGLAADTDVLVLTHSHALDFELCLQLLRRDGLGFIGLIGSATKRATFRSRLQARGFTAAQIDRLQCPIGVPWLNRGPERKHPGMVALSVVAQLAARRQNQQQAGGERGERSSTVAA